MRPCVPDRIGIWKYWFLRRGGNRRTRRRTSQSKEWTNNKLNPYGVDANEDSNQSQLMEAMGHPCSPNVPLARHALSSRFRKMQNIHLEEKERTLKEDR